MTSCGQFVYAWAGEGSKRGYQIIAASGDISRDDLNYASLNALPASFSTGDFLSSIRAYFLPSRKLVISYIAPAGKDLLGRPGTYYNHSLVVPVDVIRNRSVTLTDLFANFVKDDRSISYLIQSFQGTLVPLPAINVEPQEKSLSVTSIFKNQRVFSILLQHLFKQGSNIIIGVEKDMTEAQDYLAIDGIFQTLPADLLPLTFSTFSNAYASDFSLFRIIFTPMKRVRSNTFPPNQYLVVDPSGSYFPYNTSSISSQISKLSQYLLQDRTDLCHSILEKYKSYGNVATPFKRIQFAVLEKEMEDNPDIGTVFELYEKPLDSSMRLRYRNRLVELGKLPENLNKYIDHFNSLVSGSVDQPSFDANYREAAGMVLGTGDLQSIKRFLSTTIDTARTKRFTPDYTVIFSAYSTTASDEVKRALREYIVEKHGVLDEWTKYIIKQGNFVPFSEIKSFVEAMSDRKTSRKFVETVFFKINEKSELPRCTEFLKEYLGSDRFELDVGFDIFKILLKKARNAPSTREREDVLSLSAAFKEKGKSETELAKLVDKVK